MFSCLRTFGSYWDKLLGYQPSTDSFPVRVKDKSPPRRLSNTAVAQAVRWVRSQVRGVPAHTLIWTIVVCSATVCLLWGLQSRNKHPTVSTHPETVSNSSSDHCGKSDEEQEAEEEERDEEEEEEQEEEKGEVREGSENEEEEEEVGEEKDTFGDEDEDEDKDGKGKDKKRKL